MQSSTRRRLATTVAPLLLVSVGAIVSCRDSAAPSERDPWSDQAVVSLQVRSELASYVTGERRSLGVSLGAVQLRAFPERTPPRIASRLKASKTHSVTVKHFKGRGGAVLSIGAVTDGSTKPPQLIYAFENGRIRSIVSSEYARHGRRWMRSKSRMTYFDSTGHPILQSEANHTRLSETASPKPGSRVFARDVLAHSLSLLLPRPLYAEDTACVSEWITYAAASGVLASASTALSGAVGGCAAGGPLAPAFCASIDKLTVAWMAALAAWSVALDKLVACREKLPDEDTGGNVDGGGSGGAGDGPPPLGDDPMDSTTKTVMEFIEDAIEKGNLYCSGSGEYCIYYAT
jgi:hypothetical protein